MDQKDEPRITFLDVDENIASTEYVTHVSVGGKQVLRWAVLTTKNGSAISSRPSVMPLSDDQEYTGRILALQNARTELYSLMNYCLREQQTGNKETK